MKNMHQLSFRSAFKNIFINSIFFWTIIVFFFTIFTMTVNADTDVVSYDSGGRRDPFVSLVAERQQITVSGLRGVRSADDITLEGLVYDTVNGSYIIANGVILSEGQKSAEVMVLKVYKDGVIFVIEGSKEFKSYIETSDGEYQ